MPIYEYACDACEGVFDRMLPMSRSDEPQPCPECAGPTRKRVSLPHVIFKGDDWATKNGRVAAQMREKNRRLDQKQEARKRDAPGVTLAPNVGGERVGSWSEAQKLAASQGKDASTYEKRVKTERALK